MIAPSEVTIIVVDDEPLIAHDICGIFEDEGFHVLEPAHDYKDALFLIKKHKPQLAVLDINLNEEKSGIDIAKIIRDEVKIPYIFLTSYSDDATLEAAQEVSPYGYLVKPLQKASLLSTVKIALSNHHKILEKAPLNFKNVEVSNREISICEKLAQGMSYQEIADSEFISLNTVRYHIKNLYVKYDVNSRSNLVLQLTN